MDRLQEVSQFIANYGYMAIFLLVFLQEIGIPNPVTNELVLLFGGYLSYFHSLSLKKVFITVVLADVVGTSLLFFTFYFFGKWLLNGKHKWFPVKPAAIIRLKQHVHKKGNWGIFLGRLTPFLRGYISVAAGILHVKPKRFIGIVTMSAIAWSGGLVTFGWLIAPYWNKVLNNFGIVQNVILLLLVIVAITLVGRYFIKSRSGAREDITDVKPTPKLELE